jgi:hypothetical protein
MKKLIAILVVFAVMTTALFAQEGSWSIGSGGEIGTVMNFVPLELRDPNNPNSEQTVILTGQARQPTMWDGWGNSYGSLELDYRKGDLHTQFAINTNDPLTLTLEYADENKPFWFHIDNRLSSILTGSVNRYDGRLYGGFNFLDNMLKLVTAIKGQDQQWWRVSGFIGDGYAVTNNANFLMVQAKPIAGLNVGFILPNIFRADNEGISDLNGVSHTAGGNASRAKTRFVQDSLERMTFGISYESGPFGASAHYALQGRPMFKDENNVIKDSTFLNTALYAGAYFNATDAIRGEFALHARFFKSNDDVDRIDLRVGGRFQFTANPLQARLDVIYLNDVNSDIRSAGDFKLPGVSENAKVENGAIRFVPFVRYDIVPQYLRFKVDAVLDFPIGNYLINHDPASGNYYKSFTSAEQVANLRAPTMAYRVRPEIWFNFMGTGATDSYWWPPFTGIIARYSIQGWVRDSEYTDWVRDNQGDYGLRHINDPTVHAVDIMFKWSF